MQKAELKVVRADDGRMALEMHIDGAPLAHMFVDATTFDEIIGQLADIRATLPDEVPRELEPGSRLKAIVDPIWRARHAGENVLLALRHQGLGCTSWMLPRHEAQALGQYLIDAAAQPGNATPSNG